MPIDGRESNSSRHSCQHCAPNHKIHLWASLERQTGNSDGEQATSALSVRIGAPSVFMGRSGDARLDKARSAC